MKRKEVRTILYSVCFLLLSFTRASADAPRIALIQDIYEGGYGSNPQKITDVNGQAYFLAHSGGAFGDGYGLWKSDGTTVGTQYIADLDMPDGYFNYEEFTSFKNQLFFRGYSTTNATGRELWKSNGTAQGTFMVKDIYVDENGEGESSPRYFTQLNPNTLLFIADSYGEGAELWKTDGTTVNTTTVKIIHPGLNASGIVEYGPLAYGYSSSAVVNGIYYFSAATPHNFETDIGGNELWRSDGSEAGTYMVTDLTRSWDAAWGTGHSHPNYLTNFKNKLLFSAYSPETGNELFESDGTAAGTRVLVDICPNVGLSCGGGGGANGSYPSQFIVSGNLMYFFAYDGISTTKRLWKTDGTAAGTAEVSSMPSGAYSGTIENMTAFNGMLFFVYHDGDDAHGRELWRTNGTTTRLVKDIGTGLDLFDRAYSSNPDYLTVVDRLLYFAATTADNGRELWQTDGTEEGTRMVQDMAANSYNYFGSLIIGSSNPSNLANINGTLLFSAAPYNFGNYSDVGRELWKVILPPPPIGAVLPAILPIILED